MAVLLGTSFAISRDLFGWFPLPDSFALSEIHMFAAYWVMVIVGLHVGLNWNRVTAVLRNLGAIWQPLVGSPSGARHAGAQEHRRHGPLDETALRIQPRHVGSQREWSELLRPLAGDPRSIRRRSSALWSSAPYLLNSSVDYYANDPSVEARMRAFEDGVGQKRDAELADKLPGKIDRTTARSLPIARLSARFSRGCGRAAAGRAAEPRPSG